MENTLLSEKIDLVIPWVDGNDENWLREKNENLGITGDCKKNRFRDWENLQYLFRGIDKYAPWINKVFFITWGHLPKWLNINSEKLRVVNHKEFIPKEYLPTFNSNVIELNLHRIEDLSEKFILFNDDMFILRQLKPTDFFEKGKPKDQYIEYIKKDCSERHKIIRNNNFSIINKYFSKKSFIKENFSKIFNIAYGMKVFNTISVINKKEFCDFYNEHLSHCFLKSTFNKVWELENEKLNCACFNKFRGNTDIGQDICRYWQILEGNFYPTRSKGKYFFVSENNKKLIDAIRNKRYKIICINDVIIDVDFEKAKNEINSALEEIFCEKSQFEI